MSSPPIDLAPLPHPADQPTLDIWVAGQYLGLNRVQAYRAARSGLLPTVQVSERRYKVPTASLRKMLGMDA